MVLLLLVYEFVTMEIGLVNVNHILPLMIIFISKIMAPLTMEVCTFINPYIIMVEIQAKVTLGWTLSGLTSLGPMTNLVILKVPTKNIDVPSGIDECKICFYDYEQF